MMLHRRWNNTDRRTKGIQNYLSSSINVHGGRHHFESQSPRKYTLPITVERRVGLILLISLPLMLIYTSRQLYLPPSAIRNINTVKPNLDFTHNCFPLESWQESSFPTCNNLHEIDFAVPSAFFSDVSFENQGYIRDVWKIPNYAEDNSLALKTLRSYKEFNLDNWRGQNFDALVSERLTASSFVVNIYGYCGFSAVYDYSPHGNLQDLLPSLSKTDMLRVATEISSALADLHSIDDPILATVVHDIAIRQFIKDRKRNSFLLTDFNTASPLYYRYLIHKNNITLEQCPYYIKKALDKNRAPEEMLFSDDGGGNPVSEKIDVYSFGNILYQFLTGHAKYHGMEVSAAQALIVTGDLPSMDYSNLISSDRGEPEIDRILAYATQMCLMHEPSRRATSLEVAKYLRNEWNRIKQVS